MSDEAKSLTSAQRRAAFDDILSCRGIHYPEMACQECQGLGVTVYGDTSTWRGGVGGQAFTSDVCDKCWGSGQKDRPWPSHRRFFQMERELARLTSNKEG